MNYIPDNETLTRFIPNVVTAVEGEKDLFTKMESHLQIAEVWLEANVVRYEDIRSNKAAMTYAKIIVADDAFRRAVPSLDLILTENGFGIVSNQTVAPASRDRINALLEGLQAMEDSAIESLATILAGTGTALSGTVFPGYLAQRMLKVEKNLFATYISQKTTILQLEDEIARRALSHTVLADLRNEAYNIALSGQKSVLMSLLRQTIIDKMNNRPAVEIERSIRVMVNTIRSNPDTFPDWQDSQAAKYWQDYTYKNDKNSGGFWL